MTKLVLPRVQAYEWQTDLQRMSDALLLVFVLVLPLDQPSRLP